MIELGKKNIFLLAGGGAMLVPGARLSSGTCREGVCFDRVQLEEHRWRDNRMSAL